MTKQNGKIQRSKNRTAGSPSSTESCQMEDELRPIPDLSILRKSIQTSITGFTQARDVFDTGTEELKEMLSAECDVIYECRVCRNLFRSLANFISHKRVYCRQKFNTSFHAHFINNKFLKDDMMMILQNEQDYQNFVNNKNTSENEKQFKISDATNKSTAKDLTSIVERLASKNKNTSNLGNSTSSKPPPERLIKFQSITSSPVAVYQNMCSSRKDLQDLIKDQVTELDNMISSREAILGPDGKLLLDTISSAPKSNDAVIQISDEDEENTGHEIVCKICKIKFATLKTLRFHMKHKHAPNRLVFPCPDCSDTFANAWGVYRHLFKVHRKSAAHIRKLRDSIQNKAYRLQKPPPSDKKPETPEDTESMSEQHRMDLENQAWMDNLETDGEVPRCGGCGRRFERRAALSSHRQTCQLRIAAQNKISSNLQRRFVAKATHKGPPEPPQTPRMSPVEPRIKIPKIDIKPSEKTIEIQIRRDYNKGSTASPVSFGTNSPVSEPAGDGDVAMPQHSSESTVKGENGASFNVKSIPNVDLKNISDSKINQTVQDCDDAYVNQNNSDSLEGDTNIQIKIEKHPLDNSPVKRKNGLDAESSPIDDSDLNFEDIERICHLGTDSPKSVSKLATTSSSANKLIAAATNSTSAINKDIDVTPNSALKKQTVHGSDINTNISVLTEDNDSSWASNKATETDQINEIANIIALDAHIDTITRKLFCKDCDVAFLSIITFRKHMAKHFDWKRFKCKLCHFKSYNRSCCVNHLKYQHRLSGDPNRLKTFVGALSAKEAMFPHPKMEVPLTSEKSEETIDVILLLDDDDSAMAEDTESSATSVDISTVKQENIKTETTPSEMSMSSGSSMSSLNNEGLVKKRGRPKGSFKVSKKRRNNMDMNSSNSKKSSPVKFEDYSNSSMEKVSTPEKHMDVQVTADKLPSPGSNCQPSTSASSTFSFLSKGVNIPSGSDSVESLNDSKEEIEKNVSNRHIASSTSATVKRPIRNRVKPLNKDFEYDLSNLLKLEAEAYKESHMTSNISQKNQLKRKPLLQNENLPVDPPIQTGGAKDSMSPKAPITAPKSCQGALKSVSLKAAHRGKAVMKQSQLLMTRRDLPPFISRTNPRLVSRKSPSDTPPPTSPARDSTEAIPRLKIVGAKIVPLPHTPSMISDKLSLVKFLPKIGTPIPSTPPLSLLPKRIGMLPKSYPLKKMVKQELPSPPQRSSKNKTEIIVKTKTTKEKDKCAILENMSKIFSDEKTSSSTPSTSAGCTVPSTDSGTPSTTIETSGITTNTSTHIPKASDVTPITSTSSISTPRASELTPITNTLPLSTSSGRPTTTIKMEPNVENSDASISKCPTAEQCIIKESKKTCKDNFLSVPSDSKQIEALVDNCNYLDKKTSKELKRTSKISSSIASGSSDQTDAKDENCDNPTEKITKRSMKSSITPGGSCNTQETKSIEKSTNDSSNSSNAQTEPDTECNSSDQIISDSSNSEMETPDKLRNVSVISYAKRSVLKENDEASKRVHTNIHKNKEGVNVKDLKNKLAHYLTLNQVKITPENPTRRHEGHSIDDAPSTNLNNKLEKNE